MTNARAAYDAAVARVPSIADHARIPGSQRFENGVNEALADLDSAFALDPSFAPAHAARGNILIRAGQVESARTAYARAAELDPGSGVFRYALAELAYLAGERDAARDLFAQAFERERLYSPPHPRSGARDVLVLAHAGPWPANMPLDFMLDERAWTVHRWFLPDSDVAREVPPFDVIVNAMGASDAGATALAQARRIIASSEVPAINDPAHVSRTARYRLPFTLAGIAGCAVAPSWRMSAADLASGAGPAGAGFPVLVRPVDSHGGRGLERVDDPAALQDYGARTGAAHYDVCVFFDYRNPDGWYRKYRIIFVDGEPFPYHLALDENWMIHYYRTPMDEHAWMREEEASFLTEPGAVIAGWETAVRAIPAAVGLDYFGIDCAQLPDGRLLVFEADPAMLVHAIDPAGQYAYKRPAFDRIRTALAGLLERRAQPFRDEPRLT